MLYYLHQEVIGDQAERILEGADSRLVTFPVSTGALLYIYIYIY